MGTSRTHLQIGLDIRHSIHGKGLMIRAFYQFSIYFRTFELLSSSFAQLSTESPAGARGRPG